MSRTETAVFTNMCMVKDGSRILVLDRVDPAWPGVTFPGGHVEPGECFETAVIREVYEETGLTIEHPRLVGVKQFSPPGENYRYIVLLYLADTFTGQLQSSDEGRVFFIDREDLGNYQLAHGFENTLQVFENEDLHEDFNWFEDGQWHHRLI